MKDDMISRQAAIDAAIEAADDWDGGTNIGRQKRIEKAIKALPPANPTCTESVPVADCISRQAALDAADSIIERDTSGNNDVVKAMTAWKAFIKALPSAQPEIIRCKDCRYNNDCEIQYSAQSGDEFFCGCAEGKDNG